MRTIETRPTNGVSFGINYTVVADDINGGGSSVLLFDFGVEYKLAASIQVFDSAGVPKAMTDAVVDLSVDGQIKITDDTTFVLEADDVVSIVAQRARTAATATGSYA